MRPKLWVGAESFNQQPEKKRPRDECPDNERAAISDCCERVGGETPASIR